MTQQSTHHVLHRINATVMRLDRRPQGGGRGAASITLWTVHVTIIIDGAGPKWSLFEIFDRNYYH